MSAATIGNMNMPADNDLAENQPAATYDQQGNQLTPSPPKINLHDAAAIRREQCSVYRDMRNEKIEAQDGTRLAYVLDMIRKSYETGVLQERVELLERTIVHRSKKP